MNEGVVLLKKILNWIIGKQNWLIWLNEGVVLLKKNFNCQVSKVYIDKSNLDD